MDPQTLSDKKQSLIKERDKILGVLKHRAHKDPEYKGNFVTDFPDTDTELAEPEDEVYEDAQYEVNLDIEHVLEDRLQVINAQLRQLESGQSES